MNTWEVEETIGTLALLGMVFAAAFGSFKCAVLCLLIITLIVARRWNRQEDKMGRLKPDARYNVVSFRCTDEEFDNIHKVAGKNVAKFCRETVIRNIAVNEENERAKEYLSKRLKGL